jgi:carboxyl-terminal processing protease
MGRSRWSQVVFTCLALLPAAWCATPPAFGQPGIPPRAIAERDQIDELIRQGELLERERRWTDALSYYERAVREYPDRSELQQRLTIARTHLDVARRYADRSYLIALDRLTEQQSLDLYAELLLKIDTYHVSDPNWSLLVQRGMTHLQVASTEPIFAHRHQRPVTDDLMRGFTEQVRASVDFRQIENRHQAVDAVGQIARLAAAHLAIPPQTTMLEFACAAAIALDHYSTYLTGDQLDEVFSQIEGNFVGLGVELRGDNQSLLIVHVIPGGPAAQAGIVAHERIVEVDGQPTALMTTDAAADLLRGPELSFVEIVVESSDGTRRPLRVQRRRVDVPSVQDAQIIDATHGVAYLKLTSFQKTTSRDMDQALWSLHRQGMRALIVDIRGNPGGLLNAAVEVADKFLPSGKIVSTRGRSAREDFDYTAHQVGTWRVPLVVLIDGDSASASEIFAGAIRDHHRGTVVGQRSYGKGSVQGIFPLSRYKSGVRLTTAQFFSPNGQPISRQGITPTLPVANPPAHVAARVTDDGALVGTPRDAVLDAALQVARSATNYQVRRAG